MRCGMRNTKHMDLGDLGIETPETFKTSKCEYFVHELFVFGGRNVLLYRIW